MYDMEDIHFWFLAKRDFTSSILHRYKKYIKNILDIGSGTGGMTKYLSRFGKVTGIENNRLGVQLSRKRGLKIISGKAQKLPFKNNSFDLVTFFDVLYHKEIGPENNVLNEAYRVLKMGGYILVTDSAFEFLTSEHDKVTQGKRRYTLGDITMLLEKSKFQVIRKTYIYASIFPLIAIKRIILNKILKSKNSDVFEVPKLINNIIYFILQVESFLVKHISFPFGSSVLVLAKKI